MLSLFPDSGHEDVTVSDVICAHVLIADSSFGWKHTFMVFVCWLSPGGAGGKGVWGAAGMVYEDEEPDVRDPNYDESAQVSECSRLLDLHAYLSERVWTISLSDS